MNKFRFTLNALAVLVFTLAFASLAQAQATRTWVSGVGDDANPCSRTAPCKTFAGAISKTAAGGEIDCLDPGGFGAVTITKSLTIDGTHGSGFGGILAAGTNGVIINAGATDVVTLRGLSIDGGPPAQGALNGIRFLAGKTLNVEDCKIFNFLSASGGFGIDVSMTTNDNNLFVKETNFINCSTAIRVTTTTGFVVATLDKVQISAMTTSGIALQAGGFATIRDSSISRSGIGVNVTGGANSGADLIGSALVTNTTGIAVGGSTSRITGTSIIRNGTGASLAGGALKTGCDNFIDGNTTPVSGGALTNACVQ